MENRDRQRQARRGQRNLQRQRALELVRKHDDAIDATQLARQMGLHTTTVRFHLDALCDEGVVERTRIARGSVGRPRTGYRAVQERLDYRHLAEILALELGDTAGQRRRRAEAVGRKWAQKITSETASDGAVERHVPDDAESRTTLDQRSETVATVFARMGFTPEVVSSATSTDDHQRTVRLHSCPIRDLARVHPEVGCALHRGLLQGLLTHPKGNKGTGSSNASQPRAPAELEPFVEPELCLITVNG